MIIAIITAGGFGERMKNSSLIPKQYSNIGTFNVLRKSVEVFLNHPDIHDVIVVIRPQDIDLYNTAVEGLNLLPPVIGGKTRKHSVYNAMKFLKSISPSKVLIHDAVRPLVSKSILSSVINGLKNYKAVVPCMPINDTIKKIQGNLVIDTLDRTEVWKAQTPQGFSYPDLMENYEKFLDMPFNDESTIMEEAGFDVVAVLGSKENFKITDSEDFSLLEARVNFEKSNKEKEIFCIGSGWDFHAFDLKSNKNSMKIGGIKISHMPVIAHSDGDVVLHALTDAILGAIGSGDIGIHFPNDQEDLKNEDSERFLIYAMDLLTQRNARIINVDINVIGESPKISSIRDKIRSNISRILQIGPAKVNIKGKTTEKMGFLGRKEGIAAEASVMIAMKDDSN